MACESRGHAGAQPVLTTFRISVVSILRGAVSSANMRLHACASWTRPPIAAARHGRHLGIQCVQSRAAALVTGSQIRPEALSAPQLHTAETEVSSDQPDATLLHGLPLPAQWSTIAPTQECLWRALASSPVRFGSGVV